jgi:hypothetical protein
MLSRGLGGFRVTIRSFFLLQLLIAPLFMGPFFYRFRAKPSHIYMDLLALLVAPVVYVAVFSALKTIRNLERNPIAHQSIVFAAIRSGIGFGSLFGLLVVGSVGVLWLPKELDSKRNWMQIVGHSAFAVALMCVHYLTIGAAIGGLVGLAADRCRGSKCRPDGDRLD